MKQLISIMLLLTVSAASFAQPEVKGMVIKPSKYSVTETIDKLEAVLKKKGITIVTRWSHEKGAKKVGIPLRPTELLLFGNPKLGSHFFTSAQTAGIDLPMKALAWQDAEGKVWLGYNDPQYIADRHGITNRADIVKKMAGALNKLSNAATGSGSTTPAAK